MKLSVDQFNALATVRDLLFQMGPRPARHKQYFGGEIPRDLTAMALMLLLEFPTEEELLQLTDWDEPSPMAEQTRQPALARTYAELRRRFPLMFKEACHASYHLYRGWLLPIAEACNEIHAIAAATELVFNWDCIGRHRGGLDLCYCVEAAFSTKGTDIVAEARTCIEAQVKQAKVACDSRCVICGEKAEISELNSLKLCVCDHHSSLRREWDIDEFLELATEPLLSASEQASLEEESEIRPGFEYKFLRFKGRNLPYNLISRGRS
ncbi:hypothetical protein QTI66_29075 [Variovorax sp. J22R133]|uniref:hypothetical protein n=1 Tax=Variovorax brevis TaxID=3053503 RepID=UPI0025779411|nr:hypothetical protein [Variovorax sp. J22R133]MDM0116223.1 hypothetical protein [Variovorax sp. J22R133]